jgi:hypothetical protein
VTEFVGSEQLPVAALEDAPVMVVAVVGNVFVPLVSVVEVALRFQPLPFPVSSSGVPVKLTVTDWV